MEIELRLPHAVEGEHVEKASDDVQGELPDHVVWRAPIRCEAAFDNRVDLGSDGHGVLAIIVRLASRGRVSAFLDHILDFLGTILVFTGVGPDVAPVLAFVVRVASADSFEHVLRWIRTGRAFPGAIGLEIVDQVSRIFSERTVVDDTATGFEEEEFVELFEENRGGLMDGAKDSLAGVGEFAQEADDVEGGAGVETGGGFVEEHEEFGFAGELDTNGESFTLFLIEAFSNSADGGAGDRTHFQKIDDAFAVIVFLLRWDFFGLSEESRKLEGLSDCGRWLVDVHLLCETSRSLE